MVGVNEKHVERRKDGGLQKTLLMNLASTEIGLDASGRGTDENNEKCVNRKRKENMTEKS